MNLGDPELELIDPTPNVYNLFIQFDNMFFYSKLASRAVVRWSKRMYSCAGVCSYEGRGGLCDIALSEPLLKLRPRKNLIETLLHEMIHAYLFVTCRDQDRDGHGPNFKAHMHRINQSAGLNISIYHDFHDEVKLYRTHVWRCNGPCQKFRPHFGIVRKSTNRAPAPSDYWWEDHRRKCGGTFIKIQEPDKPVKQSKATKKNTKNKPNADITKYINTQKTVNDNIQTLIKPVLKDSNFNPVKTKINGGNTLVITKKGPVLNPQVTKPVLFNGKGEILASNRPRSNSVGVVEAVRNIWANKQLPPSPTLRLNNNKQNSPLETVRNIWANKQLSTNPIQPISEHSKAKDKELKKTASSNNISNSNKHKASPYFDSPPTKMKKIDDYFKTTASNMLKDVYGHDFEITNVDKDKKLVANAVTSMSSKMTTNPPVLTIANNNSCIATFSQNLVGCPVCSIKVNSEDINRHLDECLNKEAIEKLSKEETIHPPQSPNTDKNTLKNLIGEVSQIPAFKPKTDSSEQMDNLINEKTERLDRRLDTLDRISNSLQLPTRDKTKDEFTIAVSNLEKEITQRKTIRNETIIGKHVSNSDHVIVTKKEKVDNFDLGFIDEENKNESPVKVEPSTSKVITKLIEQKCACCGQQIDKSLEDHLDECLAFFSNNNTIPDEGASTSFGNETIIIDDDEDDKFDESQTFNATGTKTPCPCCFQMVEEIEMYDHLDRCLSS